MSIQPRGWSDREVEQILGKLLQAGVLISAAVSLLGGAFYLLHSGGEPADYGTFRGVGGGLDSVRGVLRGAAEMRSRAVIQLGLLLLILTPIARVALSLLAFVHQRDRMYVGITGLVLALLLFSLVGG